MTSRHPCSVWWRAGLECVFEGTPGHKNEIQLPPDRKEDPRGRPIDGGPPGGSEGPRPAEPQGFKEKDDGFPIVADKDKRIRNSQNITRFAGQEVGQIEIDERIAAMQREELPFPIPVSQPSPLADHILWSVLGIMGLSETLRFVRARSSGKGMPNMAILEGRTAMRFKALSGASPGQGSGARGRGGFHSNAAAELNALLGIRSSPKRRKFGEFDSAVPFDNNPDWGPPVFI